MWGDKQCMSYKQRQMLLAVPLGFCQTSWSTVSVRQVSVRVLLERSDTLKTVPQVYIHRYAGVSAEDGVEQR